MVEDNTPARQEGNILEGLQEDCILEVLAVANILVRPVVVRA